MKVEIFSLCDAATAEASGKLNLLGAFDSLFAPSVPLMHPACAIAVRVRFEAGDEGTHAMELRLADSDGKSSLPPMRTPLTIPPMRDMRTVARNFVVNIQQLKLEKFGEYTVDLMFDGRPVASAPLYAMEAKR